MIYKKNGKDPNPSQVLAALVAIGLTGTFGLGVFAIHQNFPGRVDFKLKDWVEFNYDGKA